MKTVEMHVPNKSFEGYYGGVRFSRGVGIFTDIEKAQDLAKRYDFELVYEGEEAAPKVEEAAAKEAPKKRTRKAAPKE